MVAGAEFPSLVAAIVAVDFTPFIAPEIFDALDPRVATGARTFNSNEELLGYLAHRYPRLPPEALERRAVYGYAAAGDNTLRPLAGAEAVAATCAGLRADLEPYVLSLEVPALFVRGAESTFVTPRGLRGYEVPPARSDGLSCGRRRPLRARGAARTASRADRELLGRRGWLPAAGPVEL